MTKIRKISRNRVTSLLLAFVMMLSTVIITAPGASAYMWPCSDPANMSIKTYPLDETTRSIPAYQNSDLTNKVGTVYGTDQITILAAEGDVVYVKFPVSGTKNKEGWIKASYISPANLNGSHSLAMKAGGSIPVYRYESGSKTIGSISKGDIVYICYAGLDHETGRAQLIYPVSGGWKMGWCTFADIGNNWFRACGGSQTINDGIYFINVSSTHRLDGMGANENVHVWEKLNVSQQKVRITHQGSGIYHVQFQHDGTYLDQQYATQDSSTLLAHRGNGGTNQGWYIADLGNNRYGLFNVYSGLSLDVYCYRTSTNGSDILAYAYNGQAVTLEKLDGGSIARTSSIKTQPSSNTSAAVSTRQQKMADQALSMVGSTDYSGYCQRFVRVVFERAGLSGSGSAGSALEAYNQWRVSTSMNDIPVGAAVYLRSKNTSSAGYKYGHVGIYVGNGYVVHAVSSVKKQALSSMLGNYIYLGWGWQYGVDLR